MIEKIVTDEIYETLRQKLVLLGYLPDILTYDTMNNDVNIVESEMTRYDTDLKAIVTAKGFAIDLKGFGSNLSKSEKAVPRIVIDIHQFLPGNLGNDTNIYYELHPDGYYIRKRDAPVLSNLIFCVYAVAKNQQQIILLNDIIINTIPFRGYMKRTNEAALRYSNNFFVQIKDKGHTPGLPEGILERYFIYEIPDLQEIRPIIITGDNIVPISEIDTEIKLEEEP